MKPMLNPSAKDSNEWEAGIRGVLYREIRNQKRFKRIGLSIYALAGYNEEKKPAKDDKVKMHSFIEGICVELGNFRNLNTFTANTSAIYRDNLKLETFATLKTIPPFSYDEVVQEVIGFVTKYLSQKLTPAGKALVTSKRTEEIFLRQLLKFQTTKKS